jgi:hypothetical protein
MSRGSQVAGISAVVLLVATFLPWVSVEFGPLSESGSGFGEFALGKLAALCALLIIAVIAIETFAPQVTLPAAPSLIIIALGVLAIIFVGWHVLFLPDEFDQVNSAVDDALGDAGGDLGLDIDAGRAWGVFVAFIAAIGATVGGYLKLSE